VYCGTARCKHINNNQVLNLNDKSQVNISKKIIQCLNILSINNVIVTVFIFLIISTVVIIYYYIPLLFTISNEEIYSLKTIYIGSSVQ